MKYETKFIGNSFLFLETELNRKEARLLAEQLNKYKKYTNFVSMLLHYSESTGKSSMIIRIEEKFATMKEQRKYENN